MRGLFGSHPSIVDPEMRRQSRLLAVCIAVLTGIFVCVDTTFALTTRDYSPPWIGYLFLIGTFALNRTGRYRIAAILVALMFPLVGFGQIVWNPKVLAIVTLGYVALAPMIGAIFLSLTGVIALTLINLGVTVAMAATMPQVAALGVLLVGPLSMNAIVGLLAAVYMVHRNHVELDRRGVLLAEIAERERLEEQLRQAQKMEALGKFAGGIAHDFNNVLMVILGNVSLLSRKAPSAEVQQIENAVSSAASLTRQLLAFGRRAVLEPRVLDIGATVDESVGMMRRIIGERIAIEHAPPSRALYAQLDRAQIEQVLLNLATNARDAMPSGGTLRIGSRGVDLSEGDRELPQDTAPGAYVCISVADDGVGMDAETQARIFEPFFTTKERGRGTGLGLASVFGIVSQSAGFIRVWSQPGRGTRFDLYFPSAQPAAGPTTGERLSRSAEPARGHERIMIVEDDDGVRMVVTMLLSDAGYEVIAARSLREARAIWSERGRGVALVITDMVLADGQGVDFVLELHKQHPQVALMCMSGYSESHDLEQARGIAHLQKPFSSDDLLRKVRTLIDARDDRARPIVNA